MKYPFSDIYGERTRPGRFSGIPITDPSQMSRDWMSQASGTYGRMQVGSKTKTEAPDKTFGGALYAAGGGTAAGAAAGSAIGSAMAGAGKGSSGGWWGAGAGFVVGLGSYLFS